MNAYINQLFKVKDVKTIPIIINNFNRLTTLKKLVEDLENRGYTKIYILDNLSTYPPLLAYYKTIDKNYKIFYLKKNYGFKALWKSGIWYRFMFSYFCYTDSDLSLVKECPDNFMNVFYALLQKYPCAHKVGFSLKIDDLPEGYSRKNEVIEWESKFYKQEKEPDVFIAPIDTTFALYRPFSRRGKRDGSVEMYRTNFPLQTHHLPWYNECMNLPEEELYYLNSVKRPTHWSKKE